LYGRIDMDALRVVRGEDAWALLGPQRRAGLLRAVRDLDAVVGPAVPWSAVQESVRRALLARDAHNRGWVPAGGPIFADDHLPMLLVHSDPALLADLTRRRLAPLDALTASSSERLASTLLAWLALRGERSKVAEALHVHPQTVRYRVRQLRELFGPDLDNPDVRFELELVLRARDGAPALTSIAAD
jgi:DNA-binding PucR family transcriptional regulator